MKVMMLRKVEPGDEFDFTPEFKKKVFIGEILDLFTETDDNGNEIIFGKAEVISFPYGGSPLYKARVLPGVEHES